MPRLGIDIGGVIAQRYGQGDTSFMENALHTPPVDHAFAAICDLEEIFGHHRYVISKCGEKVEKISRQWLIFQNFYNITNIPVTSIHYCRQRKDKVGIATNLGLTHFVDDRLEVLSYMSGKVDNLYLFQPQEAEVQRTGKDKLEHVTIIDSWGELVSILFKQHDS